MACIPCLLLYMALNCISGRSSAERLVGAEPHDGQTQRIDREFVVPDVFTEHVRDRRRPALAFHFAMVGGVREHLFELNPSRIWGLTQVIENNVLDFDVDKREASIPDVILDEVVLPLLVDDRALNVAIQKIERVHLIPLDRESVAAEVEFGPTRQVIFVLGFLRTVLKIPIVDGFGAAHVVDANDHRVHRS